MSSRVRDLIRKVRSAKTGQQEREIIAEESAKIRTHLKQSKVSNAHRTVSKMIFISMLGYSVKWGHVHVVSLCHNAKTHKERRISYLGLSLLLPEDSQLLMMATNSAKLELESGDQYKQAVALAALGATSSEEMLRQLTPVLVDMIDASVSKKQTYARKKALFVAAKAVRYCPDVAGSFLDTALTALGDKSHAVVLAGAQLALEMLDADEACVDRMVKDRDLVPGLCRVLLGLAQQRSSGHDVGGVCDPFLQVSLLRLVSRLVKLGAEPGNAEEAVTSLLRASVKGELSAARVAVQFEAAHAAVRASLSQQLCESASEALVDALQ
ncbi:hypothetical protein KIPB_012193, partial [Kipferlia bialata]|eukprot:g12193.t1